MIRHAACAGLALVLAGCAWGEPPAAERTTAVRVAVPVERCPPPPPRLGLLDPPPPRQGRPFVAPGDPAAIAGITHDGARAILDRDEDLLGRIAALQAWIAGVAEPAGAGPDPAGPAPP